MNRKNIVIIMKKNKRGDMTVLLFVVFALIISSAALFSFITSSNKVEAKISDSRFIENLYLDKSLAEVYLTDFGEYAIVKTYEEFVAGDKYIENPNYNSEYQVRFGDLNSGLNEEFSNNFVEAFKTEFGRYDFEEDDLQNLKEIIVAGYFDVEFDGEVLTIAINKWEMNDSLNDIDVAYSPRISLKFDIERIRLHSFEEIYEVKENCKASENVKNCFEDLANFEIEVLENGGDVFVEMESKKDFLIDGEFKTIKFGFVMK